MDLCLKLSCIVAALVSVTTGTGCIAHEPVRWAKRVRLIEVIDFDLEEALRDDDAAAAPRAATVALHRVPALKGRELRLVVAAVDGRLTDEEIEVPGRTGPQWLAVIQLPWDQPGADRSAQLHTARRLIAEVHRIVALTGKKVALRVGAITAIPRTDGVAVEGAPAAAPAPEPPAPQQVASPRPAPAPDGGREITAGCDSPSSC